MDVLDKIIGLLEKKADLFAEYEQTTGQMRSCNEDVLTQYITKRGDLAIQIDEIVTEILGLCAGDPEEEALQGAISNRSRYGELPEYFQPIYMAARVSFGAVGRIQEMEPEVVIRLESLLADAEEGIRASQHKPQLMNYFNGIANGTQSMGYLGHGKA